MQESQSQIGAARNAVVELIKREGPVSADSLAEKLGVTTMAVRLHIQALSAEGYVDSISRPLPRGRPVQLWHATAKAEALFADSHAALTVELIGQMKKAFGEEGMDKVLKLRTAEQEKTYRVTLDRFSPLKSKLDWLAKIRSSEGYMAEVRTDGETGDWLFVENHCPICAAAKFCTGLCREELALFQRVLGKGVKIERIRYILADQGRCTYRVSA